ncbi:hypothetical protein [Longispora albida]|uniref:hypothetical protein n=1 Tax=Longispora albida TaxID=203523 RepID=UPI00037D9E88|nr:hypothetical protein [Longispora albida]
MPGHHPAEVTAPPPPPGPGVQPPFVAPPSQRDKRRTWFAVVGGVLAVFLCVGGAIGTCAGLAIWMSVEQNTEARAATDRYMGPLQRGEYSKAYLEMCSDLRELQTAEEFAAEHDRRPRIQGYEITRTEPSNREQATVWVTVRVQQNSSSATKRLRVVLDPVDKRYQVCSNDN